MIQKEKVLIHSEWVDGRTKFEQVDLVDYPVFISRFYSPNGICMDEEVTVHEGELNGLIKIYLKEKKRILFMTQKASSLNGVSIVMTTSKKTFKEKIKHIWNTQKNNWKNLFS